MELVLLSLCIIISSCTHVAAAVNKSLQSCPTLCDPRDGSSPGSSVPGADFPPDSAAQECDLNRNNCLLHGQMKLFLQHSYIRADEIVFL